jgi:hypothetical protein
MALRLDPTNVLQTLETLHKRIEERFSGSGLSGVAAALTAVAGQTGARAESLRRPMLGLRILIAGLLIFGAAGQVWLVQTAHITLAPGDAFSLVQGLESAVNLVLLVGAGVWFLVNLEERLKRRRVLAALHELRSLAHVVDMHQLTKDPTILLGNFHRRTSHSPARAMSEFELTRYLEYCAEMLALVGKLAALYAEDMRDAVVIEAVNDIENLCANLGRKIWQKITIIKHLDEGAPTKPAG